MDCHRATLFRLQIVFCVLFLLALSPHAYPDAPPLPANFATTTSPSASPDKSRLTPIVRAFRNDAALNAIFFADPLSGWAVGDRGVIWHTGDAGATWRHQSSPVSCTLNEVFFIDGRRGWIVGGQCQPYSNATRGVVLRTDDGGATWLQLPQPLLSILTGVKFFDRDQGIAYGQCASYYPSGVFATRDGGGTWQPLPADQPGAWLTGDFIEPDAGAVAGPAGQIATLVRRKVIVSPLAATSLRSLRAMRLVAPTGGWAAGDGGLLLMTSDLGHSWQTSPSNPLSAEQFDFHAVAVQVENIWIAGSPGTLIFHSADGGKSWQPAATGQTAPLRAIQFIDAQHGWAAGDFGNILATHDGGQSWQTQRAGAQRAALLAIFANPADVPLEVLANCGAADGYIAAVDILCHSADGEVAGAEGTSATGQRTRESLLLAGAASANTAWQFPLPSADLALTPDDLLAALNRENDGRAIQQLENHLVRELRMWRPDVVITQHAPAATSAAPVAALIERLVVQSVAAAADANQHSESSAGIGLAAWQVKKVYGLTPPGMRGEELIETARFSPWLGATFAEFASPARRLLFAAQTSPPDKYELQLLMTRTEAPGNARGLFSGISLAPGSDARRQQPDLPARDLDALRRLAMRRRNLEQLLQRTEGNEAWVAQVTQMIDGLTDDDTGRLLVQLAEGYRKSGRLDLAADTYFLLARRTPDHPLVDPALTWLIQFYASSEVAHRMTVQNAIDVRHSGPFANDGAVASATVSNKVASSSPVQQAAALAPIAAAAPPAVSLSRDDRLRRAVQLTDYLKTTRPALYAEPGIRYCEVTAQRQLGYANPAKRFFLLLRQLPETDPWRQCAATEEWLDSVPSPAGRGQGEGALSPARSASIQLPPPKKLAACRQVDRPPHLDGRLDEPFWENADRLILHDDSGRLRLSDSAEVRLAHDDQFIYVAIHCLKVANLDYQPDDRPRPHDSDLTQHDRVTLHLDVDHDYTTAFELTVDHRGWTRDACWGDVTWEPTWYVAAAADETSWTIEAAIPLAELVDRPPASRDIWAVAVRRTIPRTGHQSWASERVADNSPSQFGLLIFE